MKTPHFLLYFVIIYSIIFTGCSNENKKKKLCSSNENLNATLWMQTSVEYDMVCKQTYKAAVQAAEKAQNDITWTASLEQIHSVDFSDLPVAIIVDVDETILDNSPFQARLVKDNLVYHDSLWIKWVKEEKAKPIPGAKEFVQQINEMGIKIFYVSNRQEKQPTVRNLQSEVDSTIVPGDVFLKNEKPEWSSDKTSRRALIAQSYRILLLIGDDYNDFAFLGKVCPEKRKKITISQEKFWGERWFILPNPTYGSFDKALWNYDYAQDRDEKLAKKKDFLRTED